MDIIKQNQEMIKDLRKRKALKTKRIIDAFQKIPRHLFIPEKYLSSSYGDFPLPTMHGQTISQPYTVAMMLEALKPKKDEKILEIGTGSGWTAALIGYIVGEKGKVVSIDIFDDLIEFAKENIEKTRLKNIILICADGKKGYKKEAPYDRVIINAACDKVPKDIIEQTKVGGTIVAPINDFLSQKLMVFKKRKKKPVGKSLGNYLFVPLR